MRKNESTMNTISSSSKIILKFDNQILRRFPVDSIQDNYVRNVNALQSRVKPTPVKNPRLIAWSESAARIIGLDGRDSQNDSELISALAGNHILPGSEPTAHNYCGYQFGTFAGQLGDGAAITLGEVIVPQSEKSEQPTLADRCLVQLKGAGLTPYSRTADGRKVVRSSIREFLCSEAMFHLNIATTRALSVIKTDDTVVRDMFYTGNAREENCAIVCRLSECFFRFGTFELFKTTDPLTSRPGPMVGRSDVKNDLIDFIICNHFKNLLPNCDDAETAEDTTTLNHDIYLKFFKDVVMKSAELVAKWQCVGFCHGVLNTDNMSIIGQTIDYGPFGFMERFNPNLVSNTSDDGGRYRYCRQPPIVEWNLYKLSEALDPIIKTSETQQIVRDLYKEYYHQSYHDQMKRKLGLLKNFDQHSIDIEDKSLIENLFGVMQETYVDFSNLFRKLHQLSLPGSDDHESTKEILIDQLTKMSATVKDLEEVTLNEIRDPNFTVALSILRSNPSLLARLNIDQNEITEKLEKITLFKDQTDVDRANINRRAWTEWVEEYCRRLAHHYGDRDAVNAEQWNEIGRKRVATMKSVNPRFVLRNHVTQEAIQATEDSDDFSLTRIVLALSETPFDDTPQLGGIEPEWISKWEHLFKDDDSYFFQPLPPNKPKLKVSCSS